MLFKEYIYSLSPKAIGIHTHARTGSPLLAGEGWGYA